MTARPQGPSMTRLRNAIVSAIGALPFAAVVIVATTGQQPSPAPAPATGPPTAPSTPNAPRGPAPSLARPASPTKASDRAGFLQRWLILEPLKVPGQLTEGAVQALVKKEHVPESLTAVPKDGEVVHAGDETLTWRAVDTTAYNVNLFHFAYALNKPTSNVLFWAVTVVDAPREMPGVRLAIGSNAASVWWLNGQEVIGLYNDRQAVIDDGVSPRLTLKKGPNVIRAAIVNAGGATDFCARFLDGNDAPIIGLVVRLDAAAGATPRP
jgi:hypothetical protein